jgi:hypothetical protein
MPLDPLRLSSDDNWRWFSRVAAYFAAYAFGSVAILAFGMAVFQIGANALHWFNTGTWGSTEIIAEAWPSAAAYVKTIDWIRMRDIGLRMIAQSVSFAYLALGVICLLICSLFMQLSERLETAPSIRQRANHDWL